MDTLDYDVVVIGAGPVGENVADRAVRGGLRTVIVEAELVGGECSYWACMPSKALLRSAAALRSAARVGGAAEAVDEAVDAAAVLRRRDGFAADWHDDGQVAWLGGAGIDLIRGHAEITGVREVTVTRVPDDPASPRALGRSPDGAGAPIVLRAGRAVAVCTGSVPVLPEIPGLADAEPWSSRDATAADGVPETLAIIGGGVVAVEMATAYAGLGSIVHLLNRSPLLAHAEPFAGDLVAEGLAGLGVVQHDGVAATRVTRTAGRSVALALDDGDELVTDEVLVATGRVPRTADLGLASVVPSVFGTGGDGATGTSGRGALPVDDSMLVTVPGEPALDGDWLYAVGDVNGRAPLTHQGKYQARIAGDAIAARARGRSVSPADWSACAATADHGAVPQVAFCEPEVAWVGLTAEAARDAGHRIRVIDQDLGAVAGAALHADGYRGRARLVVDEDLEIVLGATFVGPDVAELLHAATIAVVGEVPIARLWHAVPAYPTMSEVWLRLLESYGRPVA